ncbi:MAG TPA: CxxH/CxxC protein [Firmicutes bacterium]|jgi:CxxH/CxxC protein (TIGR04129 family)|nr:CxxH/CxxC protein [Bacillota bacterium]HBE07390.1 CxxH/CxxC protein [Bacillota bacterium]HBG42910.1 CxxH/CxxC protein [Bacillota bacterium]HCX71213.1 CxxH/CxxC protein [Bacillota bacterium]
MIKSCAEHIELAIDDFIEEFEISPNVEALQSGAGICRYCTGPASYQLRIEEEAAERSE